MDEIKTSRGQVSEMEEIVSNILASVDHIQEIPTINEIDMVQMVELRRSRDTIIDVVANNQLNLNYHCAYKHILLARMQLKELIQARLTNEQSTEKLFDVLRSIEKVLQYVRIKYFNIPETALKNPDCVRCVEDYFANRQQRELMQEMDKYKIPYGTYEHQKGGEPANIKTHNLTVEDLPAHSNSIESEKPAKLFGYYDADIELNDYGLPELVPISPKKQIDVGQVIEEVFNNRVIKSNG